MPHRNIKQSSVYIEDDIKKAIKILCIEKPEKWSNMSDFIREAVKEKIEKELSK